MPQKNAPRKIHFRRVYLFQIVNIDIVETMENAFFWERFTSVCNTVYEFDTTVISGFSKTKIRLRGYMGLRCIDLMQKSVYFERFAYAFSRLSHIKKGEEKSIETSHKEQCLMYAYTRLMELIEEISEDVEKARTIPSFRNRRKLLNRSTKIILLKSEKYGIPRPPEMDCIKIIETGNIITNQI